MSYYNSAYSFHNTCDRTIHVTFMTLLTKTLIGRLTRMKNLRKSVEDFVEDKKMRGREGGSCMPRLIFVLDYCPRVRPTGRLGVIKLYTFSIYRGILRPSQLIPRTLPGMSAVNTQTFVVMSQETIILIHLIASDAERMPK